MTYQEFKNKWLGRQINFDNAFGAQCMDVYRMYVAEVLGVPQSPPVRGAKDVWGTYLPEYFDRIANTPEGVPAQGDIVIWGMGKFGHIGICDHADTKLLTTLEQNWANAGTDTDGKGVTELRQHTYANVLGWLKFKAENELRECLRLLHEVVIPEKEGLEREYKDFKEKSAAEIKSRDDKILELEQKIKQAETYGDQSMRELKKIQEEDYQRIQSLSQKLLSRPDWPGIISEIDKLLTVEDQKRGVEKELAAANEELKGYRVRTEELERRLGALQPVAGHNLFDFSKLMDFLRRWFIRKKH